MFEILLLIIAETQSVVGGISGNLTLAVAGFGAAIGVGLIGMKAVEAVGRNPGSFGRVLTLGIIGMALAEAIAIYALVLALID